MDSDTLRDKKNSDSEQWTKPSIFFNKFILWLYSTYD